MMCLTPTRKVLGALALITAVAACEQSGSTKDSSCPAGAQRYWDTFRGAVLKGEIQAVAGLTKFPFQLSVGTLDFDRKEKYLGGEQFIAVLPRLLSSDAGVSDPQMTMAGYVQALSVIPPGSCTADGTSFRVGDWEYELKAEGWRFVRAYAGDEFEE